LRNQQEQGKQELEGLQTQWEAITEQLALTRQEQAMVEKLRKSNHIPATRRLEVKKEVAELRGKQSEVAAAIAKTRKEILATDLEIIDLKNEHLNEVLASKQEVEIAISDLTEKLRAAEDVLTRTVVRSPASGIVMDLQVHTVGSVVAPGAYPNDYAAINQGQLRWPGHLKMSSSIHNSPGLHLKRVTIFLYGYDHPDLPCLRALCLYQLLQLNRLLKRCRMQ